MAWLTRAQETGEEGLVGWVSAAGATGQPFLLPVGADPPPLPTPAPDSPPDTAASKPSPSSPEEKAAAAGGPSPLLVSTLPFPKKTLFGWGNTSAATISARQQQLSQWLTAVLAEHAEDMDVMEFVNFPEGGALERVVWGEAEVRTQPPNNPPPALLPRVNILAAPSLVYHHVIFWKWRALEMEGL
eukprot:COSAG04_NODE_267_length_18528_cov_60.607141_10_plen_186_part_00